MRSLLSRLKEESGSKEGKAALKLLESRGLTDSVLAECSDWLDEVKAAGEATPLEVDEDSQKEQEQAAQDAWAWHREWSQIARTVITRGCRSETDTYLPGKSLMQRRRGAERLPG